LPIYECFDGDEPAAREGKARTAEAFSEALQSYLSRSFDQATSLFRQILAENPGDGPAAFFLILLWHFKMESRSDDRSLPGSSDPDKE
jgi:hypothetical protein